MSEYISCCLTKWRTKFKQRLIFLNELKSSAREGTTGVEHLPHHSNVKGLRPDTAASNGKAKRAGESKSNDE
jgi:hypothetical protein